jgi:sporulation protein YlmC with PRC-barrel domain
MNTARLSALAMAAALIAAPALAQSTPNTAPGNAAVQPGNTGTMPGRSTTAPAIGSATPGVVPGTAGGVDAPGAMAASTTSPNPVLTDNGQVRASKVIGESVYNDKNEKVGSVDDILLGKDEKATRAVISVGGVLGVGAKLVAVPYSQLKFSPTIDDKTSRVMIPGVDENALNGMPTFHFASK